MPSARRSPPTERVVRVLDFLFGRGGERFGLSELSREAGISKPTCLGIVTELTEGGYLVRDPWTHRYGLGPALVAAGRMAGAAFPAGELAQARLAGLSRRFWATCTASGLVGDRIRVVAQTGPDGEPGKIGQSYPFAPPVGLMYVLWDDDRAVDRWLALDPILPVRQDHEHLAQVVRECRERGYLVEGLTTVGVRLHSLLAGVAAHDLPPEVRELVGEVVSSLGERVYLDADLGPRQKVPVNLIAAPTFDSRGGQELVLTLHVGAAITGADIARRGATLVEVAAAVTAEAGGTVSPPAGRRTGSR